MFANLTHYSKCKTPHEKTAFVFAHLSLFTVFVWFGFLKVIGISPASGVVLELLTITMPWMPQGPFMIGLGLFEMFLGILFLIPRMERLAIGLLVPHMITTFGPLLLLPELTWQIFGLVPTLEGQYIIKNLVIIALAVTILFDLKARKKHRRKHHAH